MDRASLDAFWADSALEHQLGPVVNAELQELGVDRVSSILNGQA